MVQSQTAQQTTEQRFRRQWMPVQWQEADVSLSRLVSF
nr:MAG TPA: hypothetical protein [Caudoviricetes sp.]